MRIRQSRIHDPRTFLHSLSRGEAFYITLTHVEQHASRLQKMGFSSELRPGEKVLPKPFGPISDFNSDGKEIVQRDQPKETLTRDAMIQDWHGNWHYVDIPYERYPRLLVSAPGEELLIEVKDGKKIITSRQMQYLPNQLEAIKHVINLFLELFGECDIFAESLLQLHQYNIERRNWKILPSGDYPWEKAKDILREVTKSLPEAKRRVVDFRFKHISKFTPTKLIIGIAGFDGYVIFCFEQLNMYLLESRFTDNATYIFGNDWESLSQLTKGEIINGGLHKDRIIHTSGWPMRINRLFASTKKPAVQQTI